jgi:acetyl esterase/lipase
MWAAIILGGAGIALALAVSCSPLKTFDALVPKDGGSIRVASDIAYGAGDRRQLDIYAPIARPASRMPMPMPMPMPAPMPVIVFFYGGSWSGGTRQGYAFVGRALAAQGFLVVIPDYRLVPEIRYPAFVEDGAAAVKWVEGHAGAYGGDPARIIVAGHSAGAYIAAMLALDDRWLGPARSAVRGFVGLAGPYDFLPFDVAASKAAFGQWPDPEETQPIHWAGAGDPPALLLAGAADETVRPRNSAALADRLRAAHVSVDMKLYAGLGHVGIATALARPFRGKAPVLADIVHFARQVTSGR